MSRYCNSRYPGTSLADDWRNSSNRFEKRCAELEQELVTARAEIASLKALIDLPDKET